jgi:hypothetical protein
MILGEGGTRAVSYTEKQIILRQIGDIVVVVESHQKTGSGASRDKEVTHPVELLFFVTIPYFVTFYKDDILPLLSRSWSILFIEVSPVRKDVPLYFYLFISTVYRSEHT